MEIGDQVIVYGPDINRSWYLSGVLGRVVKSTPEGPCEVFFRANHSRRWFPARSLTLYTPAPTTDPDALERWLSETS